MAKARPPKFDDFALIRMECELLEAGIRVDQPLQWQQPRTNPPPRFHLVARDDGHVVAVDYAPDTTADQQKQGEEIIRASDIRPRNSKSRRDLLAELTGVMDADPSNIKLAAALALAYILHDNPLYARRNGLRVDGAALPEKVTPSQ